MDNFRFRTEDIPSSDILSLFVETVRDREAIDLLKSPIPAIVEGSRGTGKSFLMRTAEAELWEDYQSTRVVPIYVSFIKSSLIHTDDFKQFHHWMLAKTCAQIVRTLRKRGIASTNQASLDLLVGNYPGKGSAPGIEELLKAYEESWRNPSVQVHSKDLPDVSDLKDILEDLAEQYELKRFCFFFDEAAHIFRPEQQRQFFTLFRDLRSPFITCNAAVYPGVTSYGDTFQPAHDANFFQLERDILHADYLSSMREIVEKQADSALISAIERNRGNFNVIAYAVSGNPRLLLKTVSQCPNMRSSDVDNVVKNFYRSDIWSEHSSLGDLYQGHKPLVDWGRDFIEKSVLPETKQKNDQRAKEGKSESTCYFWIHRDAPEPVQHALRLLAYTGIVQRGAAAVRGTRSELGTRYSVNLGCLFALEANPAKTANEIAKNLSIKRFTEFGASHDLYSPLSSGFSSIQDPDVLHAITGQMNRPIEELDITQWQIEKLKSVGISTVADVLNSNEEYLIKNIKFVGEVRARQIMNAANAAVLEYLSG
jgi:hypothetical protein